jgi:zinc-finger of transposase IS204/IS1001/IS1096/IS1165
MWTEITRRKYEREGQRYASDVTDAEWALIEPHMPAAKPLGRPRDTELRAVLGCDLVHRPDRLSVADAAEGLSSIQRGVDFDATRKVLTIGVDFVAGSRFAAPGVEGVHRVHDTQTKRLRHLNFFQHECYLEVRTPRVKLPDGRVVQIESDWFGKLSGFTLLFEARCWPWPSR